MISDVCRLCLSVTWADGCLQDDDDEFEHLQDDEEFEGFDKESSVKGKGPEKAADLKITQVRARGRGTGDGGQGTGHGERGTGNGGLSMCRS